MEGLVDMEWKGWELIHDHGCDLSGLGGCIWDGYWSDFSGPFNSSMYN